MIRSTIQTSRQVLRSFSSKASTLQQPSRSLVVSIGNSIRSKQLAPAAVIASSSSASASSYWTVDHKATTRRHYSVSRVAPNNNNDNNNDDDDSHSDFAPQKKKIPDSNDVMTMIQSHVQDNPVMLYMKGSPNMPQCGFSARVVSILQGSGVNFASVNVLDYPSIREGVKQYSQWPTIPQLFVQGELVGGCDIVESMHASGELQALLEQAAAAKEQKET